MKRNEHHKHWTKVISQWRESGLTAKEFAEKRGISHNTLQGWKWRLSKMRRLSKPRFVEVITTASKEVVMAKPMKPVPVITSSATFEHIEVVLPDGIRVRVPSRFDAEALRRVVVVLETR